MKMKVVVWSFVICAIVCFLPREGHALVFDSTYKKLEAERNNLVNDYNKLVNDYNKLCSDYDNLAAEHNKLVGEYNKLKGQADVDKVELGNARKKIEEIQERKAENPPSNRRGVGWTFLAGAVLALFVVVSIVVVIGSQGREKESTLAGDELTLRCPRCGWRYTNGETKCRKCGTRF